MIRVSALRRENVGRHRQLAPPTVTTSLCGHHHIRNVEMGLKRRGILVVCYGSGLISKGHSREEKASFVTDATIMR